jgi:DNA-binding transcriptional regulator PaaX
MVLALAMIRGRDFARMSLSMIMARASLSERTVQKAIKNLEGAGILRRVRTGRAAIYRFQTDKSRKIVETENTAGQTRKNLRVADTPGVTPATPQSIFRPGVGEELGEFE